MTVKIPPGKPETPRFIGLNDLLQANFKELKRGAEVGVRLAQTSVYILERNPDLTLFLIDSYVPYLDWQGMITQERQDDYKARALKATAPYIDRAVWIYEPSSVACQQIKDKSLDYVFIDATHRAESVYEDCLFWAPKVRPGGLLLGHDFCHPDVKRGVALFEPNENKVKCMTTEGDIFVIEAK